MSFPEYYVYEGNPSVLMETPDGGLDCQVLDASTGEFERNVSYVGKIMFGTQADIREVTREEFIQWVEKRRGERLQGEGPVFALYDMINALEDQAKADGLHRPGTEERALIATLRKRTFEMFEADLKALGGKGLPEGV
jgi:hypothetical protein